MLGPGGRPARSGSLCRRSNPRRGSRADEAGLRARVFAGCACCLEPRGASGARGTRAHAPSTGWSRSTTTTTLREATVIPTGNFPPRRPTLAEPKIVGSNFRRSFCSRGSSPDTGGIAMCISRGLGLCGRITGLLIILCTPLGKGDPTKAVVDPSTEPPYLHLRYKIFNSNSAFLLKRANQSSLPISISQELHHQPFLVMNTADKLPVINVAYGPFSSQRPLPEDLWPGNILNSFTEVIQLRWNFRAFIIEREIFSARPRVKVLFYITGWDWDGKVTHEKYPCIGLYVLHAQQKMTTFCRLNVLGVCLAEIRLPSSWFLPKVSPNEDMTMDRTGNNVAALYYTVRTVGGGSFCGESRRAKLSVIHFLNEVSVVDDEDLHWVANVTLSQAALQPVIREVHLDENILIYIPDKTLRPKEIVKIPVKILKNSTIQNFTLSTHLPAPNPHLHGRKFFSKNLVPPLKAVKRSIREQPDEHIQNCRPAEAWTLQDP
uniref:Uncharacterized protein n=1 Tax=Eptatretus burgeri TaxID=7764 RepID=A0A8C4QTT9_EPTBU